MRIDWTEEKEASLRADYPILSWEELQIKYSTTKKSLLGKANKLGIKKEAPVNVEGILQDYGELSLKELCDKYKVGTTTIYRVVEKSEIPTTRSLVNFGPDEEFKIAYCTLSIPELVAKYGTKYPNIKAKASRLGVERPKELIHYTKVDFKPSLVEFIQDYQILTVPQLVKKYNVARPTIRRFAKRNKLNRPEKFLHKQDQLSDEQIMLMLNQYNQGCTMLELSATFNVAVGAIHRLIHKNKYNITRQETNQRIKDGCIKKYGVENVFQSPEIKLKTCETNIERYGCPFPHHTYGKTQAEIQDWLNSFGFNFAPDHKILSGKEIDMYDPTLKLGVEYCGLYWHNEGSPEPRGRNYHYSKFIECEKQGIRLITIFEDEWIHRQAQIKNFLKSVIGKNEIKLHGRKCEVKQIEKEVGRNFFEQYHLQGKSSLGLNFAGLFNSEELVGVMSFGRHHRDSEKRVLDRLCFKDGVSVAGGSSKLFKFLLGLTGISEITSWSDNRISTGGVYKAMGFTLEEDLGSDYSYVKLSEPTYRLSKQSQKKDLTNCPEGKTEKEWSEENGLFRIFDCGKKRWVYKQPVG